MLLTYGQCMRLVGGIQTSHILETGKTELRMYKIRVRLHGVFHLPVQAETMAKHLTIHIGIFLRFHQAVPPIEHGEVPGFAVLVFYEIPIMGRVVVPTHRKFLYATRDSQGPANIHHHVAQIQAASSTPIRNLRPNPDIRPHLAREIKGGTQQAVEHEMGRISGLHDVRIVLVLFYDRHKLVI